jgi:hypothetical protein
MKSMNSALSYTYSYRLAAGPRPMPHVTHGVARRHAAESLLEHTGC